MKLHEMLRLYWSCIRELVSGLFCHGWLDSVAPILEKEMATHSSVLAWRIPGTEEPGGLLSMGSHKVGHDWSDLAVAYWSLIMCQAWVLRMQSKPWPLGACCLWAGDLMTNHPMRMQCFSTGPVWVLLPPPPPTPTRRQESLKTFVIVTAWRDGGVVSWGILLSRGQGCHSTSCSPQDCFHGRESYIWA